MITKFKIFENVDDLDPYGEEEWEEPVFFKSGDKVICVNDDHARNLNIRYRLEKDKVYTVNHFTEPTIMFKSGFVSLEEMEHDYPYKATRFKKVVNEHIAYLDDDGFDYDPEELLDVVGLPSGEYFQIKRKDYSRVQKWVNWSEKWQSYVYIDRFLPRILENLPLNDLHPYTKNG